MIPSDLSAKYGLSEEEAALAVEDAMTKVLAVAFDMEVRVRVDEPLEILALGESLLPHHDASS